MPKFKIEKAQSNGWSRWVRPVMQGYRMACCDCSLVHDMEFVVVKVLNSWPDGTWQPEKPLDPKKYRVLFRAKRNNRSTARLRKKKGPA